MVKRGLNGNHTGFYDKSYSNKVSDMPGVYNCQIALNGNIVITIWEYCLLEP